MRSVVAPPLNGSEARSGGVDNDELGADCLAMQQRARQVGRPDPVEQPRAQVDRDLLPWAN